MDFQRSVHSEWLRNGEKVHVVVCWSYRSESLDQLENTVGPSGLPKQLSELYTLVGWNSDGNRTPQKNTLMLNLCGVHVSIFTDEGRLIGFGRVPYDPYVSAIFDVITHPEFRRLGVAKLILKSITDVLDREGRSAMLVNGSGFPDLYCAAGFVLAPEEGVMYRAPTTSSDIDF